jgi:hypothetical protein
MLLSPLADVDDILGGSNATEKILLPNERAGWIVVAWFDQEASQVVLVSLDLGQLGLEFCRLSAQIARPNDCP